MRAETRDSVNKVWALCNALKDDGVTFHQYLVELSYLLFLKLAAELKVEHKLPQGCRWTALTECPENILLERYGGLLRSLATSDSEVVSRIFSQSRTSIKKAKTLRVLVQSIDRFAWYEISREGLGDLYEGLLEKNANEKRSGAGQYFTPRLLIDSIVRVMKPSLGDVIQDPAAGTAGFLVSAGNYIRANSDTWSDVAEKELSAIFHGVEHVDDTYSLALMNLFLHGLVNDDAVGLVYGDTLSSAGKDLPPATLILSNPPFGTKRGGGLPDRDDLPFPTSNKQLCFVQHIISALAPGGRAAIVVPDNVLYEETVGLNVRRYMMDSCDLHTMLRLPPGLFYAASVKTHVLFITKNDGDSFQGTKELWLYDLRGKGHGRSKSESLTEETLRAFEHAYGHDPNVGREARRTRRESLSDSYQVFSRAEIRERGDNLALSIEVEPTAESQEDPEEALLLLEKSLERSMSALRELSDMVRRGPA
ncbi:HsdM family class I SAM-dependent methyltransferase [Micromonospora rhizosphaerae]|uniref:HsdM family class I SAM-dependent methyltransferase n=1 Tax=Micromonospora rhizosphaerae TaxID=568872 RepID=UPI000B851165|nr:N-6 DNA methylase [Micromonospora rhizosphaerae]